MELLHRICFLALLVLPLISGQEPSDAPVVPSETAAAQPAEPTEAAADPPVVDDAAPAAAAATQSVEVTIAGGLDRQSVNIGDGLQLTCQMSPPPATVADNPVQMKWLHDGVLVESGENILTVGEDDPGNFQMEIMSFNDDMAGNYTCVGTSADGSQSDSATIIVEAFQAIQMKSELSQFGILGEDKLIECDVSAKPSATIAWYKGTRLRTGDKYVVQTTGLLVKGLTKDDEGVYQCKAAQTVLNKSKRFNIQFAVVVKPTISIPITVEPAKAMIGSRVTLTCTAEGDPAPAYKFLRNAVEVDEAKVSGGVYTIESLVQEDEANYTCEATNIGGMAQKSHKLDVLVPPTMVLENTDGSPVEDNTMLGVEDQAVSVVCSAKGDPLPNIIWSRDGVTVDASKLQTDDGVEIDGGNQKQVKSTLTFASLAHTDKGTYTCTATNGVGDDAQEDLNLEVQYGPKVGDDAATDVYGWIGGTSALVCQFAANPSATLRWYRKLDAEDPAAETKIEPDAQHLFGGESADGDLLTQTLSVTVEGTEDFGDYMCDGTNQQGSASHTISLKEAKKPGPVTIYLEEALTSVLKLKLTPPADDGQEGPAIKEYIVEYKQDGATDVEEKTETRDGSENTVRLTALKSATTYVITVTGKSDAGLGVSDQVSFMTLTQSKPTMVELDGGANQEVTLDTNKYTLKWVEPDDGGSPITGFTVTWEKVLDDMSAVDKKVNSEVIKDLSVRTYTIKDLEDGYSYLVKVTATNEIGESSPAMKTLIIPSGVHAETSSASLGGGVIAIIIIVILLVVIIVVVIFFVARKKPELVERMRGRGARMDEEGGVKEGGKDPAEEEKLIKKDDAVRVENEVDQGAPVPEEAPVQEFEPDNKPEPVEVSAEQPAPEEAGGQPLETEIKVTGPESPEKSENPVA